MEYLPVERIQALKKLRPGVVFTWPDKGGGFKDLYAEHSEIDFTEDEFKAQYELEKPIVELETQRAKCKILLAETDTKMVSDTPYPSDLQKWIDVRQQWRDIIKSDKIEAVPKKPF
jgi:hypothetical protein